MLNPELWEVVNGVLGILGFFVVGLVIIYLLRNISKTYHEPVRFITLALGFVILGHTIKDTGAYLTRCCGVGLPDWLLIASMLLIGLGKLGIIKIWSDPNWGRWPWIAALVMVAVFLFARPA